MNLWRLQPPMPSWWHNPRRQIQTEFAYAETLFKQRRYAEAERLLNAVSQRDPGNEVASALRQSALLAQDGSRDTMAFELEPFPTEGIRSAFAPYRNGNTLYFTGALEKPGARDPYTDLSYTDLYQMPVAGGAPQLGTRREWPISTMALPPFHQMGRRSSYTRSYMPPRSRASCCSTRHR